MVFGFVVGREDRIRKKMEEWSKLVEEFNRKLEVVRAEGTWLCPECFNEDVDKKERPKSEEGDLGRLKCKKCRHKFRREELPIGVEAPARIVNHIIRLMVLGVPIQDIASVVSETAKDFGFNYVVGRSTIYGIIREVVKSIEWLDRFIIVGLLEGILCYRLECDEIFQRRAYLRILKEYLESEEGGAKVPRFFYIINAISTENRYPLPPDVAEVRNKNAFISFFLKIGPYLRDDPKIISCDELKPLMSSSKLRFPISELDTTKRKGAGKTMMEKTAHVERLNRQYRKALPKRKKVGSRMVALTKAKLCRFNICYCSTDRRIVEALGIPWPNITTISELVLFAKFVQRNAERVLGDELKVFENPIVGRCVLTINFDPEAYSLIKRKIPEGTWPILGLNAWIPYNERVKIVKDLLDGKVISRKTKGNLVFEIDERPQLSYNLDFAEIIFDDERNRMHFVVDLLAGRYQILIPLTRADRRMDLLTLEEVWVDAGKVSHYTFSLTYEEMLEQDLEKSLDSFVHETLSEQGIEVIKRLLDNIYLVRRCRTDDNEIVCPKEVEKSITLRLHESKDIELLVKIAEHFDATHVVSVAVWFANEALLRCPRPHTIDKSPSARKWLLAALYKVLEKIVGAGLNEYSKVLRSFGIDFKEIEEHVKAIEVLMPKTFESLYARLLYAKSPLDANIERFRGNSSSL